jgi:hypothetical protein
VENIRIVREGALKFDSIHEVGPRVAEIVVERRIERCGARDVMMAMNLASATSRSSAPGTPMYYADYERRQGRPVVLDRMLSFAGAARKSIEANGYVPPPPPPERFPPPPPMQIPFDSQLRHAPPSNRRRRADGYPRWYLGGSNRGGRWARDARLHRAMT